MWASVGWFGQISLAGFALVLLLPYQPRLALLWPGPALLVWLLCRLAGG